MSTSEKIIQNVFGLTKEDVHRLRSYSEGGRNRRLFVLYGPYLCKWTYPPDYTRPKKIDYKRRTAGIRFVIAVSYFIPEI